MSKRITIEVDDDTHAKLKAQADNADRALVKHIKRTLEAQAAKGEKADA